MKKYTVYKIQITIPNILKKKKKKNHHSHRCTYLKGAQQSEIFRTGVLEERKEVLEIRK